VKEIVVWRSKAALTHGSIMQMRPVRGTRQPGSNSDPW
jgi:hypothetical protein